jgi:hypothetical protein
MKDRLSLVGGTLLNRNPFALQAIEGTFNDLPDFLLLKLFEHSLENFCHPFMGKTGQGICHFFKRSRILS